MAEVKNKVDSAEVANFCSQVGLLLDASLPLYDGMETIAESSKDSKYADLYQNAYKGLNETGSLYEALKQDERWPEYMVELTGIGEQSGQMDRVMSGLTDYYERESRLKSAIINAVTYPLVLGVMIVVIVALMVWKVLPVFRRVMNSMGRDITGSGRVLINMGSVIGWVVLILVALLVIAVLIGIVMLRGSGREKLLDFVRKVFPAVRKLDIKLNASRVASVLSIMLSSGFPTLEAFRLMPAVLSNKEVIKKVNGIYDQLNQGEGFADAVTKSELFGGLEDRMIKIGSTTGREEQVMQKISEMYEEQVEDGIAQIVGIIEPTLIALLSIVIGAILLSVMLPMIGILANSF